jgi:ParB-like chromosome segregation protein Spo0J
VQPLEIKLNDLMLDPNNYRLQEYGHRAINEEKFHLEQVQRATYQRVREEGIRELHDSIIANGFVPIERIVVSPLTAEGASGKFLVVEGNRRVAALMQIKQEFEAGIDVPDRVIAVFDAVPCLVVDASGQEPYFREALMGIRHVGGIKQWGGYQRAKLIGDMRDTHGLELSDIAAKLGLSPREVNRRYRALKALEQMGESDDYGDLAAPKLYPLFHEAVALPEVRDWLSWNGEKFRFDDAEQTQLFYSLITETPNDDGQTREPKLKTYSDVRELKTILPNAEAKRNLFDLGRPFVEALTISNRDHLSKKWRNELSEALTSLQGISAIEVTNFQEDDLALLEGLSEAAGKIKSLYLALKPSNG